MTEPNVLKAPKPVLTFVVGISGHRPPKLAKTAVDFVEQKLAAAFRTVNLACADELQRNQDFYSRDQPQAPTGEAQPPAHRVRLLSGFAEGTDQIAARIAPSFWDVEAILPYPRETYEVAFSPELSSDQTDRRDEFRTSLERAGERVVELPEVVERDPDGHARLFMAGRGEGSQAAYARQGAFMLRQIDLLIAVWDGLESPLRGGTHDVVVKAVENGIPVVWISSNEDRAPWLLSRPEDFERETDPADALDGPLQDAISQLLRPSSRPNDWLPSNEAPVEQRLRSFFAEDWRDNCYWFPYECLKRGWRVWRWTTRIPMTTLAEERAQWEPFVLRAPDGGGLCDRLEEILLPRFAFADAQAIYYSHAYRSAYVLAYVLSTLAVVATLVGALPIGWHEGRAGLAYKAALVVIELILVCVVILIVRTGKRNDWHARWMDYRALAEQLRQMRFLALMGETNALREFENFSSTGAAWAAWYLRATVRELGLPRGLVNQAYQRKALMATRDTVLAEQIDFNLSNYSRLSQLHHRLHFWGDACFIATAAILVVFLGFWAFGALQAARGGAAFFDAIGWRELSGAAPAIARSQMNGASSLLATLIPWIAFLAALLPVWGAAIAGIRFTGDFEGFAGRSKETSYRLERMKANYDRAIDRVDFDMTAETLRDTARVMTEDLSGWQSLYALKRLTLPA